MKFNEAECNVVDGITVDEAVRKYEPMVHSFVNKAKKNHVCTEEDLCQEGRMAIVIAYNTYDPTKKSSLTTWTYHMVKAAVLEYQKQHLSILSGGAYLQNILRKAGQDATTEQIMEFGVSKKTALAANYINDSFATADFDELASMISDENIKSPLVDSFDWQKHLNDKEIFAVGNFFGFNGKRMTMQEIGDALGKSRKSVSYMINRAIVKLKHVPGIELYAFD